MHNNTKRNTKIKRNKKEKESKAIMKKNMNMTTKKKNKT